MAETDQDRAVFLQLLGQVRLHAGERDICPRGRKARALLAYLSVAPARSATRERLSELFWSDRGAEQARGSLRQALAEVRRCAADERLLAVGRERVSIELPSDGTDLDAIHDAARDRRSPDLARLLGGIEGGFGQDLGGLSPGCDEWIYAERPRQHERIVAAVLDAAGDMLGRAHGHDLHAILRGLDQLDPWNEAVARLGMRVDHGEGDQASLHRRYRRLEEGLAREFDSRPSHETRSLFARLTSFSNAANDVEVEAVSAGRGASPASAAPTIIVAPIAVDPDGRDGDLAAICSDDIRCALTRLPDLRVVTLDEPDAERLEAVCAGAVGVYMLSGRLRRLDGKIRVSLQLGNAQSRVVLWSEHLRIDGSDLFDTVDQVTERAAGAVLPSIDRDLSPAIADRAGGRRDTALLYTQARLKIMGARTFGAVQEGCALLDKILDLDDRHLGAHLLLARMYYTDCWHLVAGHDVAAFRARGDAHSLAAAAVDPNRVEVHVRRAWSYLRQGEWELARAGFERVLAAVPHDADTINQCATGLSYAGHLEEAEALMQRAFRLNPFPPTDYHADHAVLLALGGRAAEAEEHFAVSGEQRTMYLAARLANAQRLGASGRKVTDAVRPAFADGFRRAWRPKRPPEMGDVLTWLDQNIPVKRPEHRRFLHDGLTAALADKW